MSRYNTIFSSTRFTSSDNDDLIMSIALGDINKVKKLINSDNVNNVIQNKNKHTALHFAVVLHNPEIVKYLLSVGADPKIKNIEDKDSIDLSSSVNKRHIFDYLIESKDAEIQKLKNEIYLYKDQIVDLNDTVKYFKTNNDRILETVNLKKKAIEEKDIVIVNYKRKLEESDKAYENLLKSTKKSK